MDNPFNEVLKRQKEFQEYVSQFQNTSLSKIIMGLNIDFDANKNALEFVESLNFDKFPINSIQETLDAFPSFTNQSNSFNEWASTFQSLTGTSTFNLKDMIPDSLYRSLVDLTTEIENKPHFRTDSSDRPVEITVASPHPIHDAPAKAPMNWANFINIVLMLLAFMVQLQDSNLSSKQHEEKMAEERKQTRIMESQKEIDEQILIELQSQSKKQDEIIRSNQLISDKFEQLLQDSIKSVTVDPADLDASEMD